jgi:hypothetical protein
MIQQGHGKAVAMAALPIIALAFGTISKQGHRCFLCQENFHF